MWLHFNHVLGVPLNLFTAAISFKIKLAFQANMCLHHNPQDLQAVSFSTSSSLPLLSKVHRGADPHVLL